MTAATLITHLDFSEPVQYSPSVKQADQACPSEGVGVVSQSSPSASHSHETVVLKFAKNGRTTLKRASKI